MKRASVWLILLFAGFLGFANQGYAQAGRVVTLTGTVVSDSTGEPLAGAHVFIAVSMMGSVTDNAGRYRLEGVPLGAHRLYVTTLGYASEARDILLRQTGEQRFDFRLKPTLLETAEVTIEAKADKKWKERLEKFTRLFIGESPNAESVKIINPEVLDFEDKGGQFVARAGETLIIENRALGYKIQYFLKEFGASSSKTWYDGEPLYEEMTPTDDQQAELWKSNRKKAFMGSFRHFALALLAGRLKEQGFAIFSRPDMASSVVGASGTQSSAMSNTFGRQPRFPLKESEIISEGPTPNEKLLDFHGGVEIIYMAEKEDESYKSWIRKYGGSSGVFERKDFQTSWILLEKGATLIDYKGDVADPFAILFTGYLAFERVADELPKEYRVPAN